MANATRVWIGVALMTLISLLLASRLTVESDVLTLMPESDQATAAVRALNREEGGINLMSVVVAGRPENTTPFMQELQGALESNPEMVGYALYDVDDDLRQRLGLVQLDPELTQEMEERLQGALSLGPAIANPFIASRLLDLGPLTDQLKAGESRRSVLPGAIDGVERMLIRPTGPAVDLPFCRDFIAYLDQTLDELDPESRGVRVLWKGGAYQYNVDDYEQIVGDMKWTAILAVVLVLGLLLGALREGRVLFMLFTPLALGMIWTFGFAGAAIGRLNNFTAVFGAVLVGLGIDFAIHLYSRYREERGTSERLEDAVVRAWDSTGPPSAAAGITSMGGFMALLLAQFKGFSQMGMLLAFGVMACLFSVMTVLPLLIQWREKQPRPWRQRTIPLPRGLRDRPPTYRFAPAALLGLLLVTVGMGFIAPGIEFLSDLSELRGEGKAYTELDATEQKLVRMTYAAVIATYPDAESLRAAEVELEAAMAAGELPAIARVVTVFDALPADQQARLDRLASIRDLSSHEHYGLLPAPIRSNLALLSDTPLTPVTVRDLPKGLRHVLGADQGRHRLLVFPGVNVWDLGEVEGFKSEVEGWFGARDVPVAGEYLAVGSLARVIQHDAPLVGVAAILLVWLGTFVGFLPELLRGGGFLRFLRRSTGAMIVLTLGITWGAGALALADVKLSLFNMVGVPILLGIGVDVVIHLLHRLAQEGPGRVLHVLSTTGWASGLSALTTVLSFASLSFAEQRGIASLGMVVLVGLTTVTVAAFLIVPVGWMTMWKLTGDAPADAPPDPR